MICPECKGDQVVRAPDTKSPIWCRTCGGAGFVRSGSND